MLYETGVQLSEAIRFAGTIVAIGLTAVALALAFLGLHRA